MSWLTIRCMVSGVVDTGISQHCGNTLYTTSHPGGAWMSGGATGNNNGTTINGRSWAETLPRETKGWLKCCWVGDLRRNRREERQGKTFWYFFQRSIIEPERQVIKTREVILMKCESLSTGWTREYYLTWNKDNRGAGWETIILLFVGRWSTWFDYKAII